MLCHSGLVPESRFLHAQEGQKQGDLFSGIYQGSNFSHPILLMHTQSALTMCERCDGLCCRVYDIVDTDTGKLVKRAGEKCGYLDIKNRCRIHTTRDKHAGYKDSCSQYDCLEGGPIVTIFARRIPQDFPERYAIISSLLETIRLRIEESPLERYAILDYIAKLLNSINIDDALMLCVKVARVKIERWEKV